MSYFIADFSNEVVKNFSIHRTSSDAVTAAQGAATALGSDTNTHSREIEKSAAGLDTIGSSIATTNTRFMNDLTLIINKGHSGGLTSAAMATAITAGIVTWGGPVNSVAPVASGTGTVGQTLSTTNGTWSQGSPTFTYQWQRDGVAIPGATSQTYVLVAGDSGHAIRCRVLGSNAAGSTGMNSNAITVS